MSNPKPCLITGRAFLVLGQEESEELLQQTAEAGAAEFSLKGVYDVEAWVRAVQDNRRLHAAQLSAILSTLQVV